MGKMNKVPIKQILMPPIGSVLTHPSENQNCPQYVRLGRTVEQVVIWHC